MNVHTLQRFRFGASKSGKLPRFESCIFYWDRSLSGKSSSAYSMSGKYPDENEWDLDLKEERERLGIKVEGQWVE